MSAMAPTPEKTILVVEDNADMAALLRVRLESVGYEVHTEASGAAGVSYAAEHQPDLVILDLKLPDLSGYDVCKQLRTRFSPWTAPILMLTAMNQPIDELRGWAYGADAYLTKPCDPAELIRTISMLLEQTYAKPLSPANAVKQLVDGAKEKRFDRHIVKTVMEDVSLYPVGTVVRLSNGTIGVVERVNPRSPLKPFIKLTQDAHGQPIQPSRSVNLETQQLLSIKHIIEDMDHPTHAVRGLGT